MSTTNNTSALKEGVIIQPSISIFQGRKKLRPEDLPGARNLPPEEVASLGSKMVIDRKEIRPFNKLKRRIERDLDINGGRFLKGAWLISQENFETAKAAIDEHIAEFRKEAAVFVQRFEDLVEAQIQRFPEFADALRRASVPKEAVAAQISASYVYYTIEVGDENGDAAEGIAPAVEAARSRIFRDVSHEVERLYEESIAGKPKISRKAIGSLLKVRDRLENVAFLNQRAQVVADHIGVVIDELPKTGAIVEVGDMRKVEALVLLLSSSVSMEKLADNQVGNARDVMLIGGFSTEGIVEQPGFFQEDADQEEEMEAQASEQAEPKTLEDASDDSTDQEEEVSEDEATAESDESLPELEEEASIEVPSEPANESEQSGAVVGFW